MKKFINDFFSFSKRERQGIIVLVIIIIFLLFLPRLYFLIIPHNEDNLELIKKEIDEFNQSIIYTANQKKIERAEKENLNNKIEKSSLEKIAINPFDINKAKLKDWNALGFSKKQSEVIYNYIKNFGPLDSVSQLMKIYIIDAERFNRIKEFLFVQENDNVQKVENGEIFPVPLEETEINTADTTALLKIGLDEKTACTVIKYRDMLGGFYSYKQYEEIFGIKNSQIEILKKYAVIDTSLIIKINLNQSDFKTINRHPYVDFNMTKSIFHYRELMGGIKSINDLIKNNIIDKQQISKLSPYIEF